ncbi:MAG: pyruvate dehydrogenase (acetyl-transferring) E1 component subunit alpha [Bacillus sp. (in: firmicutes)]
MKEQFPIKQVMDHKGYLIAEDPGITDTLVWDMYKHMHRIRTFDRKAISLQRQGRIGTYAPFEGQEAAQVGSAMALRGQDWMFPTYRDHGAILTYGQDLVTMFLHWQGRMEGYVPPEGKNIFPPAVPIATQIPHAAGAAWAEKRKGTTNAAIVYFGDGATSEGDFHEGMNFASVFQVPLVLFNQNNSYAISLPIEKQMNSETIAQKAVAYGMPSVRIDGNDCFSVYFETKEALEKARNGGGPYLIEAVTWRKGAHTTADDPSRYKDTSRAKEFPDPLPRLEAFMKHYDYWDETKAMNIQESITEEIDTAIVTMEKFPKPPISSMFDYVYAQIPAHLQEQKDQYLSQTGGK